MTTPKATVAADVMALAGELGAERSKPGWSTFPLALNDEQREIREPGRHLRRRGDPPRCSRVGRARGDTVAGDPGGREDRSCTAWTRTWNLFVDPSGC